MIQTGTANADGTLNRKGTDTTIQGSHLSATNAISIQTGELNLLNSSDTSDHKNETEHGHITAQMTVYGASGGASVSGSFDRSKNSAANTTVNNTTLNADNINLDTTGDANLRGANVHADSVLTANIEGDLNVESQQNRSRSKNNSMGVSGGISLGGQADKGTPDTAKTSRVGGNAFTNNVQGPRNVGGTSGVNGGINASNGMSVTRETVLTSLTSGGTADINVKGNTQITSALIATVDAEGKDTNKLNFDTKTLSFTDLRDTNISNQTSAGVSGSFSLNERKEDPNAPQIGREGEEGLTKQQIAAKHDPSGQQVAKDTKGRELKANTSNLTYENSQSNSASKTLATLGHGNITVGGTQLEQNGELTDAGKTAPSLIALNRDTANTTKELWHSEQSQTVDATLDHNLVTKEGWQEIIGNVKTLHEEGTKAYDTVDHKFDGYVERQTEKAEDKLIAGWRAAGIDEKDIPELLAQARETGFAERLANINNDIHNAGGPDAILEKQPPSAGPVTDKPMDEIVNPNGVTEVLVEGEKDQSLGSQIANFNADTYSWVESLDPDKKAKVEAGIQLATGGPLKYAMAEVATKTIELVTPESVMKTMAEATEGIQREVGRTETSLLVNITRDHVDTSIAGGNDRLQEQSDGNAWMTGMIVGGVTTGIAGKKAMDNKSPPIIGGAHKDTSKPVNDGMDSHHCPAKNCYKDSLLSSSDGPAIKIDPTDHKRTASYGSSDEAIAYRKKQEELVSQGKLMEAIQMDIDDIRSNFGNKYDDAISEMLKYAETIDPKLLMEPKK